MCQYIIDIQDQKIAIDLAMNVSYLQISLNKFSGEVVRIVMTFPEYSDAKVPYMYHCHILEHEDQGMMGQFVVV